MIHYTSGDMLLFRGICAIIHMDRNIPYAVYVDTSFHYTLLHDLLQPGEEYIYKRLFRHIEVHSFDLIIKFLNTISKDIDIIDMIDNELSLHQIDNKNICLIYYIYNSIQYIPDNFYIQNIDSPTFFQQLFLKNNSFINQIYLNI